MKQRRKITDRRVADNKLLRSGKGNRRVRACRRLNNIAVEWIPFSLVHTHPHTRNVFREFKLNG